MVLLSNRIFTKKKTHRMLAATKGWIENSRLSTALIISSPAPNAAKTADGSTVSANAEVLLGLAIEKAVNAIEAIKPNMQRSNVMAIFVITPLTGGLGGGGWAAEPTSPMRVSATTDCPASLANGDPVSET